MTLLIAMGIFLIFGIGLYSLIKQRQLNQKHFHQQLKLELLWATIPFIIVIALALPAIIELIQRSAS